MLTDLRDALRGLRTGKGTTALAFAILTLTLAAGTVTFSVVDAVALRSLPYPGSDRLIAIAHLPRPDGNLGGTAPQDYFSWRESTRSFEALAGAWGGGVFRLNVNGAATEWRSARATSNLFEVLGVQPALGRLFRPEEETPGHNTVLVLTHSAWTRVVWRRSGSDRTAHRGDRVSIEGDLRNHRRPSAGHHVSSDCGKTCGSVSTVRRDRRGA